MSSKRLLSYTLFFCWILYASVSQAQIHFPPENIRVHATMQMEDSAALEFVLLTKGHDKLKATIQDPKQQAKIQLIYSNNLFYSEELLSGVYKVKQFEGDEAVSNLFDLLALNPEFHFENLDTIEERFPTFKGYDIKYLVDKERNLTIKKPVPISLELYSLDTEGVTLIRRIEFISFHSSKSHYLQPKEILFKELDDKENGRLIIHKFEYNSGLPDFLFKIPKVD